jgi:predicted transcriptional regulator
MTVQTIYNVVHAAPTPLTRLEIARAIQRRKTPHLIAIIEEMVRKGWLIRTSSSYHNGVVVYLYSAADLDR